MPQQIKLEFRNFNYFFSRLLLKFMVFGTKIVKILNNKIQGYFQVFSRFLATFPYFSMKFKAISLSGKVWKKFQVFQVFLGCWEPCTLEGNTLQEQHTNPWT